MVPSEQVPGAWGYACGLCQELIPHCTLLALLAMGSGVHPAFTSRLQPEKTAYTKIENLLKS